MLLVRMSSSFEGKGAENPLGCSGTHLVHLPPQLRHLGVKCRHVFSMVTRRDVAPDIGSQLLNVLLALAKLAFHGGQVFLEPVFEDTSILTQPVEGGVGQAKPLLEDGERDIVLSGPLHPIDVDL